MSSINKIKLPSGTTYDVNDVRISGVDTTPTSGSSNVVTSGGVYTGLSGKAPLASPALTGTPTAPTATAGTNTTQIATTAFVKTAIDALPEPMIFKGSLGAGGTITTLPAASSSNEGYTYKVITAGTYAGQVAKVGDTFISTGTEWVLIPSGDEPSGTVTSVGISNGGGLSVSGSPVTSSGTITIGHSNSVTAQNTQALYPIKIDAQGHISSYGSAVSVNNGTLTIQKNGTNVATFSANQSGNSTANITVPTNLDDVSDGTTRKLVVLPGSSGVGSVRQIGLATATAASAAAFNSGEASGEYSFAEGESVADGDNSHAEGFDSWATGDTSHAEGITTNAVGDASHAEGNTTSAVGARAHAEGYGTSTESSFNISGSANTTSFTTSAAHGLKVGDVVLYEGTYAKIATVPGTTSFTTDVKLSSSAISSKKILIVTEVAYAENSHVEGWKNIAGNNNAHAEGWLTKALGHTSHAEGRGGTANANYSHAEGRDTTASGEASHAEGYVTTTSNQGEHAEGKYNISISGSTIHTVGIGTGASAKKNAHAITTDGKHYIPGIGTYTGTETTLPSGQDLATIVNSKTSNTGTVTSVGAGTGLSISGTASVNPTVNVASGYKLPTITEWGNKADLPTVLIVVEGNTFDFDEVLATIQSGEKMVLANSPAGYCYVSQASSSQITFQALPNPGYSEAIRKITYKKSGGWQGPEYLQFENTTNKVTSISSSSTNTQYPSAKAVYDVVTSSDKVFVATYGVTTGQQLINAFDSGKLIYCYNDWNNGIPIGQVNDEITAYIPLIEFDENIDECEFRLTTSGNETGYELVEISIRCSWYSDLTWSRTIRPIYTAATQAEIDALFSGGGGGGS